MSKHHNHVFVYLSYLLLTLLACTATDHQPQTPGTPDRPTGQDEPTTSRPCRQIVWRDNNNRYVYQFDSTQRLRQCTAFEQSSSYGTYALNQQLTYTKDGRLERASNGEDSSRYDYRNGRLASIDFFQEGLAVYRYLVSTNQHGLIVGLRGIPLNDSGLLACATRYRLDDRGRYVQLDLEDSRGVLYYRVKQGDFRSAVGHLLGSMAGVPYDLNRHAWVNWSQVFPVSPQLAGRVETFRYAAPETPADLIKRADLSVSWQRDKQGHITGQFSTDALTTIRDTSLFIYLNCP